MNKVSLQELRKEDRDLIDAARLAARHAYAPYSHFAVGAAVRSTNGRIHCGANLENACYGLGICAEVSALTAANSGGDYREIKAIAVVGYATSPSAPKSEVVTPCGRCRQLISESSHLSHIDIDVFACSGDLKQIEHYKISELLPSPFGPSSLQPDNASAHLGQTKTTGSKKQTVWQGHDTPPAQYA